MRAIFLLVLFPAVCFAEGYEIRPWAPGELGIAPAPKVQAPMYGIPPANQPAFNGLLNSETRNNNADTILKREQIIDQRLGANADNPVARGLMGTIIQSELNAAPRY